MSKNAFLICLHFHCASSEGISKTDRIRTGFGLGLFLHLLMLHGVQPLLINHSQKGQSKGHKNVAYGITKNLTFDQWIDGS